MKKRAIISLLVSLIVMSVILPALATESPENVETPEPVSAEAEPEPETEQEPEPEAFIYLDGTPQFLEYELINGTTYVTVDSFVAMMDPQAVVEEADGAAAVSSVRMGQIVDDEGNTADVVQETLSMAVSVQVPYIVANGRYFYVRDSLIMLNGHVAAPIRVLTKVFNLDVDYNGTVLLTSGQDRSAYIQPGDSYYNGDTLYWLSHIIFAESGNQSLEGKIAVGNVVMNRVNDSQFPNNIYDVLYQENQFYPVSSGSIWDTPNDESVVAAKLVMDGTQIVPTALFFNTVYVSSFASRNRPYITTIGAHAFYS